jgi:hypothetical protein
VTAINPTYHALLSLLPPSPCSHHSSISPTALLLSTSASTHQPALSNSCSSISTNPPLQPLLLPPFSTHTPPQPTSPAQFYLLRGAVPPIDTTRNALLSPSPCKSPLPFSLRTRRDRVARLANPKVWELGCTLYWVIGVKESKADSTLPLQLPPLHHSTCRAPSLAASTPPATIRSNTTFYNTRHAPGLGANGPSLASLIPPIASSSTRPAASSPTL